MRVPTNSKQVPGLEEEMALLSQGYSFVAGVDEAGRGSLAGPVVAAAVILPLGDLSPFRFDPDECLECFAGVRDSKQLTARERERLFEVIMQHALAVGVGIGSVEMIDERKIFQGTKNAMRDAIAQLTNPPQALLLHAINFPYIERSEERRVGQEGRSRWAPYH